MIASRNVHLPSPATKLSLVSLTDKLAASAAGDDAAYLGRSTVKSETLLYSG